MALSKLAVRRLTKLADFMAKLPAPKAQHFDMYEWFTHNRSHVIGGEHGISSAKDIKEETILKCGMAACAFGWATMVPSFRKAGLTVSMENNIAYPTFRGHLAFEAAKDFFDIEHSEVHTLFGLDGGDKTPKQWAKRCREFIKENA
jgi:hypothetical protein